MEDKKIVELYWQRDETAIEKTQQKYGRYCFSIAYGVLHVKEDAEECVNDTYVDAWNSMPPSKPSRLAAFLGKITRRIALDRYRYITARKRGAGEVSVTLDELAECVPDNTDIQTADMAALTEAINSFLLSLDEENRNVFIRRYWYFDTVEKISAVYGMGESCVKMRLKRMRDRLAEHLKKEGINI